MINEVDITYAAQRAAIALGEPLVVYKVEEGLSTGTFRWQDDNSRFIM